MINSKDKIEKLKECNNVFLLGVLAKNEEQYPNIGEEQRAVTPSRYGNIVHFYIKPLSFEPEAIVELDKELSMIGVPTLYIGFDNRLSEQLVPMGYQYNTDTYVKAEELENYIDNKLILFRPIINYEKDRDRIHKNVDIIAYEDGIEWNEDSEFVLIPKVNMEVPEFEKALLNQEVFNLGDYNHILPAPEIILCGKYAYANFGGGWKKAAGEENGWINTRAKDIKKMPIKEEDIQGKSITVSEKLIFLEREYINNLYNKIESKGSNLLRSHLEKKKVIIPSELSFLKELEYQSLNAGLYYKFNDLVNFHTSIKTNPLSVISGMSGTGKTQLAELYAKTLGLSYEEGTLLILPVNPSYTEPGDILGFLNTGTGLYMPTETGLVDFLINAERNPAKMHICIFDEMNLSQVEYYFAPFISLLELKNPRERNLILYNKKSICHNSINYPPCVNIGENVRFIGSVNLDETTKDFSDRLLDRANVISLQKTKFKELKIKLDEFEENKQVIIRDKESIGHFGLTENFKNWLSSQESRDAFSMEEAGLFDELHEIIQEFDTQKGVSFRIFEKMGQYLNNIPLDEEGEPLLSRGEAIDLQIKQRLLTKLRGSVEQFEELLGTLSDKDGELVNSRLYNFFMEPRIQKLSNFSQTLQEIRRKARELHTNGYAS